MASARLWRTSRSKALRRSGRLRVMTNVAPRRSRNT
ncbi:Uncharacterised protein [Bordetella pertussis]|nr:Uncharacterised protein [Bordetella pertussis]